MTEYRHVSFETIPSTNTHAVEMAMAGEDGNVWVTAQHQTAGKARRGRTWISEVGNLYASLLIIDPIPKNFVKNSVESSIENSITSLPLVASIALHDAVARAINLNDTTTLTIKWPNDLLLNNKKISGILLEKGQDEKGRAWVVIGCGVNCGHHPNNTDYPATSLKNEGYSISPENLFKHLVDSMSQALTQWNKGKGFADIRDKWLSKSQGLGEPIQVRLSDSTINGIFHDLDTQGRLILKTPTTTHHIAAGDVFFQNARLQ